MWNSWLNLMVWFWVDPCTFYLISTFFFLLFNFEEVVLRESCQHLSIVLWKPKAYWMQKIEKSIKTGRAYNGSLFTDVCQRSRSLYCRKIATGNDELVCLSSRVLLWWKFICDNSCIFLKINLTEIRSRRKISRREWRRRIIIPFYFLCKSKFSKRGWSSRRNGFDGRRKKYKHKRSPEKSVENSIFSLTHQDH